MNEEIKKILDRLKRIDHKEYSCGFEFADSGSFDEVCRCFVERKKMADYITNLQQKVEQLKNIRKELINRIEYTNFMEVETQEKFIKYLDDLLNILNKGNDNNV